MNEEFEEINDGHYLELVDRLHVIGCMFEDHVLSHPLISHLQESQPDLMEELHKAIEGIGEAYQIIENLIPEDE